jgi:serine/threonine-protein kinase
VTALDWQRVKTIFNAAVEIAEPDRAAYVRRACAGDERLRGEVESLLASHDQADGFLEGTAVTEAAGLLDQDLASRWIGRRVGPYVLTAELGRGGMGQVFRARRADGQYQSEVAIKLVRVPGESQLVLRRFLAERQILANLVHPGIARLLDGGTTAGDVPYLVMELIDGVPIDEYCASQQLPIRARLRLFLSVCDAVSYAHRHLVVHRDLKPNNILITADHTVKLLDFGIAKVLDSTSRSGSDQPTLTLIRELSLSFASPEQIRGEAVTTASDVYSLGVLLYHLLTGVSPYRAANGPISAMAREICEDSPLPPSAAARLARGREKQSWRPHLNADLDSIAMLALQKEPARRYSSVDLLAADVQRYLDNRPVRARGSSPIDHVVKFARRRPGTCAAAALAALAIATGVVLAERNARAVTEASRARLDAAHRTARVLLEQLAPQKASAPVTQAMADDEQLLQRLESLAARSKDDDALRRAVQEARLSRRHTRTSHNDAGAAAAPEL